MNATDEDEGENARVVYSILHTTGVNADVVDIDPDTGILSFTEEIGMNLEFLCVIQAQDSAEILTTRRFEY